MDTITPPLINLDSLQQQCPRCQGEEEIYNPAWNAFDRKLGDENAFARKHGPEFLTCPQCSGLGTVPTELGRTIMQFIERHMPGVVG